MDRTIAGKKLAEIRNKNGLTTHEMAHAVGITSPEYYDIEEMEDLYNCASLAVVGMICKKLNILPIDLFSAWDNNLIEHLVSFQHLKEAINAYIVKKSVDSEALSNKLGWDVKVLLDNPNNMWNYTIESLEALCEPINVSWLDLLNKVVSNTSFAELNKIEKTFNSCK